MATIVLQAAGAYLGGMLGTAGAAIGSAAGAMAGYFLDRSLLEGTRRLEGPRLNAMRPFVAEEGAALARVYGTVRLGGNLIWATRFEESSQTKRQGAKGGPRVTTYSYYCNAAFAICEGDISGVRRIWADGRELDIERFNIRIHTGGEDQSADTLIAAKQGEHNTPAYRGVAYVVFDRFPLDEYGNRIPQFQFEVIRAPKGLNSLIRAVAMIPGATEYGLSPTPVTRTARPGETEYLNRNMLHGASDFVASLDELQMICPNVEDVALVVTWFGRDLRAAHCAMKPSVTHGIASGISEPWMVAGLDRVSAPIVSYVNGGAAYGGTPTDKSVVEAIREIRRRGLRVTLYPFVMMDVPNSNGLPDPYGGPQQPSYPWRGRVTCHPAPGLAGTPDKSAVARTQVAAFCGSARRQDFSVVQGAVRFTGTADDWGYRRLVLHYAHLASVAGGVDGFLLGSEMRGMTTLRDHANRFPFVEQLCELASEVRAVLGPAVAIAYGADWTEYFGHHPADGSGDVFFHLDALWSHEAISAVGIDNYMPLSDWRDADYGGGNPDGFAGPYDAEGLRSQVASGEGHDWYYENAAKRVARERSPITDGAHGKPWVYRYKDIRSWWSNRHFDRPGGVEAAMPTSWVPESKPIWFTELGCPAVDKGPNQPNVFPDPKSSENAYPYFSDRGRSDLAQLAYLEAQFEHWGAQDDATSDANPLSPIYGGRMVDVSRFYLWAWDARPFPAFPIQGQLWKDGSNWQSGHWLNGRISGFSAGELINAILHDHDLPAAETTSVEGSVHGYLVEEPTTARAALEPLAELFRIAAREENGSLCFSMEGRSSAGPVEVTEFVIDENRAAVTRTRAPEDSVPGECELTFRDPFKDYQVSASRTVRSGAGSGAARALSFPGVLEAGEAESLLTDWLERKWVSRETISFSLPPTVLEVTPGAVVRIGDEPNEYLVEEVEDGLTRTVAARRIVRRAPAPWRATLSSSSGAPVLIPGAPHALMLDLPMGPSAGPPEDQFRIAAHALPWRSQAVYSSPEATGFEAKATMQSRATIGMLVEAAPRGVEGRLDKLNSIIVELLDGELASVSRLQLLNGANAAALRADSGEWEVLQFGRAEEIGPSSWRLSTLLRGQLGTGDAMKAGFSIGAPFVLLDSAVEKAGLSPAQAGLLLNWRVGPAGYDFDGAHFAEVRATGGMRARLPLSPVHIRSKPTAVGDLHFSWTRRGRIDADSWMAEEIPLGEDFERYRIEIGVPGGTPLRNVETAEPRWLYGAALIDQDFGERPARMEITIRQISTAVGAGLPAKKIVMVT
ncbi:glycoside hydrolase/phage tail family protein [Aquamicrobium sp. LC103]|uniref:baseplate multidomain protein megatron n=1 Tax=Aquamicrobium sp. LC103 TaxID=1120658 RepID=UPI00063EBFD8|nr:glycoside hydrolase/phage tail family protein [Aquamicrobium sp. LC103]TKT81237.1 host specificity protein [Aquamicrobium sp. LC103]